MDKHQKILILYIQLLTLLFIGCSQSATDREMKLAQVKVNLATLGKGFNLLSTITNVQVEVSGCSSGLVATFTLPLDTVDLYQYDLNCRAKVKQFNIAGEIYTLKLGTTFNTGVGEISIFKAPSGKEAMVVVTAQLSDVIDPMNESMGFEIFQAQTETGVMVSPNRNIIRLVADQTTVSEENASSITFTVYKVAEKNQDALTVNFMVDGSVTSASDYVKPSGSIIIPANQTSAQISIDLINDDISEADEILSVYFLPGDYSYYGSGNTIIFDTDTEIPLGQQVWLKNFTSSNAIDIDSWDDDTVNNLDAVQGSTSQKPTLLIGGINGNSAAQFDGSSDRLIIPSNTIINSGGPYTAKSIFLALKTGSNILTRQIIYDQGDSNRGINIYLDNGKIYFNAYNLVNDDITTPWGPTYISTNIEANTGYSISLILDQPSNTLKAFMGGLLVGQISGVGKLFASTDATSFGYKEGTIRFHDGSTSGNGLFFNGIMTEFILYNKSLSTNDTRSIHDYLDYKFDNSKPVVTITPTSPTVSEGLEFSASYIVRRSFVTDQPLTVYYTLSGNASAGSDYILPSGLVTIPAFVDSVNITLSVLDDSMPENDETIVMQGTPNSNYLIAGESASILISDDDTFVPTPGLASWLIGGVGMQIDVSNNQLVTWLDQTSNAIDASQTTSSRQPSFQSSDNSILFDGGDYLTLMDHALINTASEYTAKTFALAIKTGADITSKQIIYEQGTTKIGFNIYISNGYLYFAAYNTSNNDSGQTTPWGPKSVSTPISANTRYVMIFEYDYSANELRGRVNNSPISSSPGVGKIFEHGSNDVAIGRANSGARFHDNSTTASGNYLGSGAIIYEIMLFNEILSVQSLSSLETYLTSKYGI